MAKLDLVGKKFGKLTVISQAPREQGTDKTKRWYGAWNCKCECKKKTELTVKTYHLTMGRVKSCGCITGEFGTVFKPNQKMHRLTMISYSNGTWYCKCDCGNFIYTKTGSIISGNTQSCGCLNKEILSANAYKLSDARRIHEPKIASARRVWSNVYLYKENKEGTNCISFEDFYELSQQDCFYCGVEPNRVFNNFNLKNGNEKSIREGVFIYNGLDRVDNLINHTKENCVPACSDCNTAKSNRLIEYFLKYAFNLFYNETPDKYLLCKENVLPVNNKHLMVSIRVKHSTYLDKDENNIPRSDIDLNTFYYLTQLPCFYCRRVRFNDYNIYRNEQDISQFAIDSAQYYYNGLDRINSDGYHTLDNIVPCCKECNWAKGTKTFEYFQNWINRIKEYYPTLIKNYQERISSIYQNNYSC